MQRALLEHHFRCRKTGKGSPLCSTDTSLAAEPCVPMIVPEGMLESLLLFCASTSFRSLPPWPPLALSSVCFTTDMIAGTTAHYRSLSVSLLKVFTSR